MCSPGILFLRAHLSSGLAGSPRWERLAQQMKARVRGRDLGAGSGLQLPVRGSLRWAVPVLPERGPLRLAATLLHHAQSREAARLPTSDSTRMQPSTEAFWLGASQLQW